MLSSRRWLILEFVLLFIGVPIALYTLFLKWPLILPLYLTALIAAAWLIWKYRSHIRIFWSTKAKIERRQLCRIIDRFIIVGLSLTIVTWIFCPDNFLRLPVEKTWLWLTVILIYPIVSVYPQELVYRGFLFRRYRKIFRGRFLIILVSAIGFAWMHILFDNFIAPTLTLIGGLMFAESYSRSASLRLVVFEHVLYGSLVFTIGLGEFFMSERFFV